MRVARSIPGLEATCYASVHGVEEDYINSYDGIVLDQFLGGEQSADQIAGMKLEKPIAFLSASESMRKDCKCNAVGLWQKPVKKEALFEMIGNFSPESTLVDQISMEYITDLTGNDDADSKELLQTIHDGMLENATELENFRALDAEKVRQLLHTQKSKIGIFYLDALHKEVSRAENHLKDGKSIGDIDRKIENINLRTKKVLSQIKEKL